MTTPKQLCADLFRLAKIEINGSNPWDPQVRNDAFYTRALSEGNMGLGEAYMEGWWECEQLDEFIHRALTAKLDGNVRKNPRVLFQFLMALLFNMQRKSRAFQVGEKHYDTGNDLFETMLDKRLTYTCGYWKQADNLDEAQEAKLNLVCHKIGLKASQSVLDIGCGWGSFAKFAAKNYGVSVVGITVSKEQVALGRKRCQGLPIEFRLQSYTQLDGQFDHVVSLGMFEHVGYKNYRSFFEVARRAIKNEGLLLLHTIGSNHSAKTTDPWLSRYIFPNSMLPSMKQISTAIDGLFVMEDLHNFGADYDKTLMAWHENFVNGWHSIQDNYSERFYRMWCYFLLACAGSFRARHNQLWQIVLSKDGVPGGYVSLR